MKLSLYITDIDQYLQGEFSYCFSTYETDMEWPKDRHIYVCDVDADLRNIARDQVNAKALEVIDAQITHEREEYNKKMALLERKKQEYLAVEVK